MVHSLASVVSDPGGSTDRALSLSLNLISSQVKDLAREEMVQLYAATGANSSSALKVLRYGLPVGEMAVSQLPSNPTAVWTVKSSASRTSCRSRAAQTINTDWHEQRSTTHTLWCHSPTPPWCWRSAIRSRRCPRPTAASCSRRRRSTSTRSARIQCCRCCRLRCATFAPTSVCMSGAALAPRTLRTPLSTSVRSSSACRTSLA